MACRDVRQAVVLLRACFWHQVQVVLIRTRPCGGAPSWRRPIGHLVGLVRRLHVCAACRQRGLMQARRQGGPVRGWSASPCREVQRGAADQHTRRSTAVQLCSAHRTPRTAHTDSHQAARFAPSRRRGRRPPHPPPRRRFHFQQRNHQPRLCRCQRCRRPAAFRLSMHLCNVATPCRCGIIRTRSDNCHNRPTLTKAQQIKAARPQRRQKEPTKRAARGLRRITTWGAFADNVRVHRVHRSEVRRLCVLFPPHDKEDYAAHNQQDQDDCNRDAGVGAGPAVAAAGPPSAAAAAAARLGCGHDERPLRPADVALSVHHGVRDLERARDSIRRSG